VFADGADARSRALLQTVAGGLAGVTNDVGPAHTWLEAGAEYFRETGEDEPCARALTALGFLYRVLDPALAEAALQEGLARYRACGNAWGAGRALINLAVAAGRRGEQELRTTYLEEALALGLSLGDHPWISGQTRQNLGQDAARAGDLEAARVHLAESVRLAHQSASYADESTAQATLALLLILSGDLPAASRAGAQAYHLARYGNAGHLAVALEALAAILATGGLPHDAVALGAIAGAVRARYRLWAEPGYDWLATLTIGAAAGAAREALHTIDPDTLRAALGDEEYEAARAAGENRSRDELVAEALVRLEAAQSAAGVARLEAAMPERSMTAGAEMPAQTAQSRGAAPGADAAALAATARLSEREREVLQLIARGQTNRQIADGLVISLNTVLRHVTHILAKTGAVNRTEAAAVALRAGLV
jgi:LuxR family maltose regulon positive regulatory protein